MTVLESIRVRYNDAIETIATVASIQDRRILAPFASSPTGDGSPHVELVGTTLYFVVSERGSEFERRPTSDSDELLYWLLSSVTASAAGVWELRHRRPGEDSRRLLFAKEVEILAALSPRWAERKKMELDCVLKSHPFVDRL